MDKKQLLMKIKYFADENPEFREEAMELTEKLMTAGEDQVNQIYTTFFRTHKRFRRLFLDYVSEASQKRYKVIEEIPAHIQQRLDQPQSNDHLRNWVDTVMSVPRFTRPMREVSSHYIKTARAVWADSICGHEDILNVILRHAVEYRKTGKTTPMLLLGPPGIGKTLIAKNYGMILQLPSVVVSGPSAAMNRGLAGAPNLYTGAGPGAIVQAMISTRAGNPVICVDEIDKAIGGLSGSPNFQNELLSALDESNTKFYDNYIELHVDVSRIPFVFTANDKTSISGPLLDRMEVIEMMPPSEADMHRITQKHILPNILQEYGSEGIKMESETLSVLVDQLWREGNRSCRPYQKAVRGLVSDAYLKMLEHNAEITISAEDARTAAKQFSGAKENKTIGFLNT